MYDIIKLGGTVIKEINLPQTYLVCGFYYKL